MAESGDELRCDVDMTREQLLSELKALRRQVRDADQRAERDVADEGQVSETLQRVGLLIASELDLDRLLQKITDEATRLCRAQFGAFFYNADDGRGGAYMLYTLSGAPREAFAKFPMPRNTAVFAPTFKGEGVVRSDDITRDPRYGNNAPYKGMPEGHLPVRSYLALPVKSRTGEVIGGLFFGHAEPGVFRPRDERILMGVAAQAGVAFDNARLYQQARRAEELQARRARQAALGADVGVTMTKGGSLRDVLQRCADAMVLHLDAALARIWTIDEATQTLVLAASAGMYTHLDGAHARVPLGALKIGRIAEERKPHLTNDVQHDPRVGDRAWAAREGLVSFAGYPLVLEGRLLGVVAMFARVPLLEDVLRAFESIADVLALGIEHRRAERERADLLARDAAARAALEASERRYRFLAEAIPQQVFTATPDGAVDYVNARVVDYAGVPAERLLGQGWKALVHPDDLPVCEAGWARSLATGGPYEAEYRLRRGRDGTYRWHIARALPERDDAGRVVRWFGTHTDITERRAGEAALRASEARYRLLAEAVSDGTWFWDVPSDRVEWNDRLLALIGVPREQWRGTFEDFLTRVHPDDQPRMRAALEAHLARRAPYELEFRLRHASGEYRTCVTRGMAEWDAEGRPVRMAGGVSDITERRRAEDHVRFLADASKVLAASLDHEAALRDVAALAVPRLGDVCAVHLVDPDGAVRLLARAHAGATSAEGAAELERLFAAEGGAPSVVRRVLRAAQPEMFSDPAAAALAPATRARLDALGFSGAVIVPVVVNGATAGAITLASLASARRYGPDDLALGEELARRAAAAMENARLYAEVRSLLAQRDAALARAESERARFYSLLMQAPAMIAFSRGPDHVFEFANELYARVVNRDVVGRPVREAFPELAGQPFFDLLDRVYTTGQAYIGREVLARLDRHGDGATEECYFNFIYQPTYDAEGRVDGILTHAVEVTDQVQARRAVQEINQRLEERVQERTAQLTEINRELESFSYTVSHDLRAPIRHVSGFVDLLQKHAAGKLDDKSQRYIQTIREAARHMGVLIDALLAFSRMGRMDLYKTHVALDAVLRDVLRDLEPDLEGRTITWQIATLPEVYGDATMLRLVFTNLVSNAVKYTRPRPEARIEIGATAGEKPGETVFFVRDNGVGFNMEYVHKLFGVFQRLHAGGEFDGTGIGLATVRRIVQRHGGRVWAEGAEGAGATFYFTLASVRAG